MLLSHHSGSPGPLGWSPCECCTPLEQEQAPRETPAGQGGFPKCIGCSDILGGKVPSFVSSPKSSRCDQPWDCTHPGWDSYTE